MADGQTCTHCNHPCHCDNTKEHECINECSEQDCNCRVCDCHDLS